MKTYSNQQSSGDQKRCSYGPVAALMLAALLILGVSQVGCISAKGFTYGFNKDEDERGGSIRTSKFTSNGRPVVEFDVAGKSVGEVFAALSEKVGVPVLPGLGVNVDSRISGVFIGKTWDEVLREVCAQEGFVVAEKRHSSGKLETYLISRGS